MTQITKKALEKQNSVEIQNGAVGPAAEVASAFQNLENRVKEVASAAPGENWSGKSSQKNQRRLPFFDFSDISGRIQGLMPTSRNVKVVLPSKGKQIRAVKRSIARQQRKLVREVNKIQKARHFSAAKLEIVILKIRELQLVLQELINAAADRVEVLYRQFVLRTA